MSVMRRSLLCIEPAKTATAGGQATSKAGILPLPLLPRRLRHSPNRREFGDIESTPPFQLTIFAHDARNIDDM